MCRSLWTAAADLASAVEAEQGFAVVDCCDSCELAVGDLKRPVRSAELNPIALGENALLTAEHFDAREPARIVGDALAIGGLDHKPVRLAINRLDAGIAALLKRHLLAPASETDDVADLVAVRLTPLRTRKIAAHKDGLVDALRSDLAARW